METPRYSFNAIYDLCCCHYEDILIRKPLKHVLDNRRVRFINPRGRFDYCYFGDFYFSSGNVMMFITNSLDYVRYHRPDQLSNTLWSTVPVIFAGVETNVCDNNGNAIFTYDICDFSIYALMVQYTSFDEPCLLADNHSVPLSWARAHGGFRKTGTAFYDLSKDLFEAFDQGAIWNINQYDDPDERQKAYAALEAPVFIDGLPEPNRKWSRDYLNINEALDENTVLCCFKSSFKEAFVDEDGDFTEDYMLFADNYPENYSGEVLEMVFNDNNFEWLVTDLMLKAHRTPEKCFVLCDFHDNLVYSEEDPHTYAQYFKPLVDYHIQNVVIPNWIVEEWIKDIEY